MQAVCSQVLILSKGRLVAVGAPDALGDSLDTGSCLRVTVLGDGKAVLRAVGAVPGICKAEIVSESDGQVTFTAESRDSTDHRAAVSRALTQAGCTVLELTAESRSLEDVFLALTECGPAQTTEGEEEDE